nr:hypothetical protein [Pseudopedobacter sp.]
MLLIFPLIYISVTIITLREFLKGNIQYFFFFIVFALSIYTTALSVVYKYGFSIIIGILQSTKEIFVLLFFTWVVYHYKAKLKLHFIDYSIGSYFLLSLFYALLPIGGQDFFERMIALKSLSFFFLIYAIARLYDPKKIYINKYFLNILILAVLAGVVVLFEVITNQHLQSRTGYADFNYYFFNFEPSGNYGLSWTFESAGGFKRFGSFFANPLEHAASTLIALAILAALYTTEDYKIKIDNFGIIALLATLTSIVFAFSRSSLLSYILIIYAYGLINKKKYINKTIHYAVLMLTSYFVYILIKGINENNGLLEVIVNTFNFSDPSSVGHVLEWVEGLNSIYLHPFGLGLGSSGRVAGSLGDHIGGENQFIIIGVQLGVLGIIIYMSIFFSIIKNARNWYYKLHGKEKTMCLAIFLIKVAFIIPLFTSEIETSSYISYLTWFLTGIFVNMISQKEKEINEPKVSNWN